MRAHRGTWTIVALLPVERRQVYFIRWFLISFPQICIVHSVRSWPSNRIKLHLSQFAMFSVCGLAMFMIRRQFCFIESQEKAHCMPLACSLSLFKIVCYFSISSSPQSSHLLLDGWSGARIVVVFAYFVRCFKLHISASFSIESIRCLFVLLLHIFSFN